MYVQSAETVSSRSLTVVVRWLQLDKRELIFFYMQVQHSSLWRGIFSAMENSDFVVRQTALEEVNTLLHDSIWNAKSIAFNKEWQFMLFKLMCDLPRHGQTSSYHMTFMYLPTADFRMRCCGSFRDVYACASIRFGSGS